MKQTIKSLLYAWDDIVKTGGMTREEMVVSLKDQISGYSDMSADELTSDRAVELGWSAVNPTDAQLSQWKRIVNRAARIWMSINNLT